MAPIYCPIFSTQISQPTHVFVFNSRLLAELLSLTRVWQPGYWILSTKAGHQTVKFYHEQVLILGREQSVLCSSSQSGFCDLSRSMTARFPSALFKNTSIRKISFLMSPQLHEPHIYLFDLHGPKSPPLRSIISPFSVGVILWLFHCHFQHFFNNMSGLDDK